jgi:D-xylose 1-dehydrogenase (NADP+, D-xylono-1,5-lactone-forming)
MTVRWGVLAAAGIGSVVVGATHGSDVVEFVAIGSRTAERARAFADRHGLRVALGSYEDLVASDAIDAVYVAAPVALHAEWTIKALQAGKHVLCEKPFAQTAAEVAGAFDAAEAADRFLAEGFMWRLHPQTALVRRLVAERAIGTLRHIRGALTVRPGLVDIRRQKATGGSALYDLGAYCVSAGRMFAGTPLRVFAESTTDGGEVDYRTVGTMWHSGDVTSSFDVGFDMPRRDELELIGSDGKIVVNDPWLCRSTTVGLFRDGEGHSDLPIDPESAWGLDETESQVYRFELEAVSHAIEAGQRRLEFGRDDAIDQARTLSALLRSGVEHVAVSL